MSSKMFTMYMDSRTIPVSSLDTPTLFEPYNAISLTKKGFSFPKHMASAGKFSKGWTVRSGDKKAAAKGLTLEEAIAFLKAEYKALITSGACLPSQFSVTVKRRERWDVETSLSKIKTIGAPDGTTGDSL